MQRLSYFHQSEILMDRLKYVKITPLIITSDVVFRFWLVFFFLPDVASGKLKGACMNQCLRISSDSC